jgi:Family of unknown function (DUF6445)
LCSPEKGGTSLYRHQATGFEVINEARWPILYPHLVAELADDAWTKRYMNGSNPYYEQVASYEAVFNRLIMYRSTSLHSGNIAPNFDFDPNPRTGRLTLNTFIKYTK